MKDMHVNIIIEIMGRPAEHIKESLNTLVVKLGSEKGVEIINKTYHDPKEAEGSKSLFTAFAEIEAKLDSLETYVMVLFTYMPSHLEILSPEKIILPNYDLSELGTRLIQRLHQYDALVKNVSYERDLLMKTMQEKCPDALKELISKTQKKGEKKTEEKKPAKKKSKKKSTKK